VPGANNSCVCVCVCTCVRVFVCFSVFFSSRSGVFFVRVFVRVFVCGRHVHLLGWA